MNLFDIAVVSIIGICLISGGFRGLIREVSGIIGLVAGFYGANTYYLKLAPYAAQWIDNTAARHLICFFVLFFGILILVGLLARLIRKLLRLVFLGWVDRTFGICFGALKGVLISTILFILMTTFLPASSSFLSGSQTAPYLAQAADAVTVFVSKGMKSDFYHHLEGIKKEWTK